MQAEQATATGPAPVDAGRPRHISGRVWVALAAAAWWVTSDWLLPACLGVLWLGWTLLRSREGPPVLALAFTFQWLQVASGLVYEAVTGRKLPTFTECDYRPMVLVGLGCLLSIAVGQFSGSKIARRKPPQHQSLPGFAFSTKQCATAYVSAVFMSGALQEMAWHVPALTQGILVLTFCRFGFLFLLFRRLVYPRIQWNWFLILLGGEVLLGFTGYFAGFRESLIIAALAVVEVFDARRVQHWVSLGFLGALLVGMGVLWTGIKGEYRSALDQGAVEESRAERLKLVKELGESWTQRQSMFEDLDRMVDRLWAVYYPALALARVPEEVPHTGGSFFLQGLTHILTPRLFFPNKEPLLPDSEKVRKYSGVMVAGAEEGTSIAFGYAAEFYVDFGIPVMFLPVFGFALFIGWAYEKMIRMIWHRELAIGLVTVVFWLSLYSFERSWARTIGLTFTVMIFLGGATYMLDRFLVDHKKKMAPFTPKPV